jgi:hypothetical protein
VRSQKYPLSDPLALGALIALTVPIAAMFPAMLTPGGSDENSYLRVALEMPAVWPSSNWGPLYSSWYFALLQIVGEPLTAFHVNTQVIYLISTTLTFLLVRRLGVPTAAAFLVSLVYACSAGAIELVPRIYQATYTLLVATALITYSAKKPATKLALCAAGSWFGAFMRPELTATAVLFAVAAVVSFARNRVGGSTAPISPLRWAYGALGCLLPLALFGFPLYNPGYNRSLQALTQGYLQNLNRFAGLDVNPWGADLSLFTRVFGGQNSVVSAVQHSPFEFVRHLGWNSYAMIDAVLNNIGISARLASVGLSGWMPALLLLLATATAVHFVTTGHRKPFAYTDESWIPTIFLSITTLVTLGSAIATITDARHGFLVAFLGLLALVSWISDMERRRKSA